MVPDPRHIATHLEVIEVDLYLTDLDGRFRLERLAVCLNRLTCLYQPLHVQDMRLTEVGLYLLESYLEMGVRHRYLHGACFLSYGGLKSKVRDNGLLPHKPPHGGCSPRQPRHLQVP